MGNLDCDICRERFDRAGRRPKLLPCAHTFCLGCLLRLPWLAGGAMRCPSCRAVCLTAPEALPNNLDRMSLLDATAPGVTASRLPVVAAGPAAGPRHFWCLQCDDVADDICEAKHGIRRLAVHREEQLSDTLALLERAASALRRLAERAAGLGAAVVAASHMQEEDISAASDDAWAAVSRLHEGLGLVGPEWEREAEAAEAARLKHEERLVADEDALHMLESARRCRLAVQGADGERWHCDVALDPERADSQAVLAVLLALRRAGKLLPDRGDSSDSDAVEQVDDHQHQHLEREEPEADADVDFTLTAAHTRILDNIPPAAADSDEPSAASGAPGPSSELMPKPASAQSVTLRATAQSIQVPTGGSVIPDVNLTALGLVEKPSERQGDKAEVLVKVLRSGVRRLSGVCCAKDPAWSLSLLRAAATRPGLEQLMLTNPREEHLLAVHTAHTLRRLAVRCTDGALNARPPELPPLVGPAAGLQWLSADGLPAATLRSLLRAHAASLRTLCLFVGTPGGGATATTSKSSKSSKSGSSSEGGGGSELAERLPELLAECGLTALRTLVLCRLYMQHEERIACPRQLVAVRTALTSGGTSVDVLCGMCDNVNWEFF